MPGLGSGTPRRTEVTKEKIEQLLATGLRQSVARRMASNQQKDRSDDAEEGCEAGSEAAEHGEKESEQNKRKLIVCPTQPVKDFIVFNHRSSEFGGMVGMKALLETGEFIIGVEEPSSFMSSHNGSPQRLRQRTTSRPSWTSLRAGQLLEACLLMISWRQSE